PNIYILVMKDDLDHRINHGPAILVVHLPPADRPGPKPSLLMRPAWSQLHRLGAPPPSPAGAAGESGSALITAAYRGVPPGVKGWLTEEAQHLEIAQGTIHGRRGNRGRLGCVSLRIVRPFDRPWASQGRRGVRRGLGCP